jgi:RHS repeat-associated protein
MAGTTYNPYRFGGQIGYRRDSAGRQYVRARHLDTSKGRWVSRDPAAVSLDDSDSISPTDLNFYWFVRNSPTELVDPTGLRSMSALEGEPYSSTVMASAQATRPGPGSGKTQNPLGLRHGCSAWERKKIMRALHDLCRNRLKLIINPVAKACAIKQCNSGAIFRCMPSSDPNCHQGPANGYHAPPGWPNIQQADCSYAAYPGTGDTIHLCPPAFSSPGCSCLGRHILWEMLNNCGHAPGYDNPLCTLEFGPYGPYGPGTPPCP